MAVRVTAVVVTYNRRESLLRCLAALERQAGTPPAILVVDNAGTDGTEQALLPLQAAGRLRYHRTAENLGGAGGFQLGIRLAAEAGAQLLWLMDDDCLPEPGALQALLAAHDRLGGQYGFLSGMAYWRDGSPCRMNIQRTGLHRKLQDRESALVPVMMATFVSLLVPVERVRAVGLPLREFFIWADDLEYTRRLSRRYACYAVPASRVLHDMHSNGRVDIATDAPERLPRYACLYRNEVYLYRREGLRGWLYLLSRTALHLLRALRAPDGRRRAGIVWRSFCAGLHFAPAVEYLPDELPAGGCTAP